MHAALRTVLLTGARPTVPANALTSPVDGRVLTSPMNGRTLTRTS